jgi:hypothetical protein
MTAQPGVPDDYAPPPRSLLWARPYSGEDGRGIELGCDCATVTVYILEGLDQLTEVREIAFTCDGCDSVRWVTIGPADQLKQEVRDA